MSKVVRFFHIRPLHSIRGGVCVKVTGDFNEIGMVDVQVAKCSRKDAYVKAIGRSEAEKAPVQIVPLRFLPRELGLFDKDNRDFTFAIKYFLPKE